MINQQAPGALMVGVSGCQRLSKEDKATGQSPSSPDMEDWAGVGNGQELRFTVSGAFPSVLPSRQWDPIVFCDLTAAYLVALCSSLSHSSLCPGYFNNAQFVLVCT